MGDRGRYAGVVCVAMLLAAVTVGFRTSKARSQASSVAPPVSTAVNPFFILPTAKSATSATLTGLSAVSVLRSEQVTVACSGCGRTRFVLSRGIHRAKFRALPPLRMHGTTRVIVGVTANHEIGRWIVFGFAHHQYGGFGHGCMSPSVRAVTPAEAADPETIRVPCGPRSPPGTEYVYWTGTDHQVYEKQYSFSPPPGWSDSLAIGSGTAVRSAPSALICSNGERDVFWEGFDRHLHWMLFDGDWNDETSLPAGTVGSAPSAAVDATGAAHVFWKGTDGYLYEMYGFGGVLQTITLNSGLVGSQPAVVARPDDTLDLFWLGRDQRLYEMRDASLTASAAPVLEAGKIASAPAAALEPNGVEDVFWRGRDGVLWELSRPNGGHPTITRLISGTLGSAPSVVFHPDDSQDVFWRGTGGGLREMTWADNAWIRPNVPDRIPVGSRPAAVLSPAHQLPGKRNANCG